MYYNATNSEQWGYYMNQRQVVEKDNYKWENYFILRAITSIIVERCINGKYNLYIFKGLSNREGFNMHVLKINRSHTPIGNITHTY